MTTATPAEFWGDHLPGVRDDFRVHSRASVVKTRRAKSADPEPAPVESRTMHPAIWRAALQAAGGDAKRVRIVSPTQVEILPA